MQLDGHLIVGSSMAFTGQVRDGIAHLDTAIAPVQVGPWASAGLARRQRSARRVPDDVGVRLVDARLPGSGRPAGGRGDRAVRPARSSVHLGVRPVPFGFLHLWRREPELVLDRAIRLPEIADEYDFRVWSAIASCLLGAAQTGLGQLEEGLARSREGMAAYQGIVAPPVFVPMLQFMDAGSRLRAGRPAEALALIAAR